MSHPTNKQTNKQTNNQTTLVGGWTNPSEKYAPQNGFIFPKFRGENKKYLSCHHLEPFCWPLGGLRSAFSNSSSMTILEKPWRPRFSTFKPWEKRQGGWKKTPKKMRVTGSELNIQRRFLMIFLSGWFLSGFVESTIDILKLDGIWMEKDVASRFADQSCLGESNLCTFHN